MPNTNYEPGVQKRAVTTQRTDNYYKVKGPQLQAPLQSNVDRLTAALDGGTKKISKFFADDRKEKLKEEASKVDEMLLTQTVDETKRQRSQGLLPSMDSITEKMLSNRLGAKSAKEWESGIGNGLKDGSIDISTIQDPEAYLDQSAEDLLSSIGDDVHERGGFTSQALTGRNRLLNQLHNAKSDYVVSSAKNQVHSDILDTIDAGKTNSASLDDIIEGVRALYPQANEAYNLNGKALDEVILDAASTLASQGDGDYDLVDRLLNDEREDVGSISGKRELSARAVQVLTGASKRQHDKAVEDNFSNEMDIRDKVASGRFTKEDAENLKTQFPKVWEGRENKLMSYVSSSDGNRKAILKEQTTAREKHTNLMVSMRTEAEIDSSLSEAWENGEFHTIPLTKETIKENGKPSTISKSQLQERAVISFLKESKAIAQKNQETPEKTFNRELMAFVRNGTENPEWKGTLNSGWVSASRPTTTPETLAQNPNLVRAITLYKDLHAKAPQLLKKHLGGNSPAIAFYDTVRIFEKFSNDTTEQAIQKALDVTKNVDGYNAPGRKLSLTALAEYTNEIKNSSKSWLPFIGGEEIKNMSHISNGLGRLAEKYVLMGLSPEAAYTEAGAEIQAAHTEVNGNLIYSADQRIPQNFKAMAEDHIKQFAKTNNLDPDELTIMSLGNSSRGWKIVYSRNMSSPGVSLKTKGLVFTVDDLIQAKKKAQASQKEELLNGINRSSPSPVIPGLTTLNPA